MNKSKRKNKKKAPRRRRALLIAAGAAATLLIAAAALLLLPGGAPRTAILHIPRGATAAQVSDSLAATFGPSYARSLGRTASILGIDLSARHGAFTIRKGTSPLLAIYRLRRRGQTPVRLTINSQRTLGDITALLADRLEFSADDFSRFLAADTARSLAPLYLDETYQFYWTDSPAQVYKKISDAYSRFWTPARRAAADSLGLTPDRLVTLASIVEAETTLRDEHGRIGRLYINRLHKGMRLQADPTVRFAGGDFTVRRISRAMLSIPSPYNTYLHPGLPPGPIGTVSPATIDAILASAPSDDLYMCAAPDFSGRHLFTASYSRHLDNAAAYAAALNAAGIH